MSKHSLSSFDEAYAIRILSDKLESGRMIKTFFKENDRTPNHDGFFELVSKSGEPRKQFVVQIKKTGNLRKCESGKNIGKYVYSLETAFLYYIKARVTESPAIYFVVDTDNRRVFFIYLSDELLMNLDFEGKEHVSYAFTDMDIINDIDEFYNRVLKISNDRNSRIIYKSHEEIEEIQEALDYINNLFNSDLKEIKESLFPQLWRFGIGYSKSGQIQIGPFDDGRASEDSLCFDKVNMFGLYPQFKGQTNQEFREYDSNEMVSYLDCNGKGKPIDYVRHIVQNIIRDFCIKPPVKYIPTIALEEKVYKQATFINRIFHEKSKVLKIDDILEKINVILAFLDLVVFGETENDVEITYKKYVLGRISVGRNRINDFNSLLEENINRKLNQYYHDTREIHYNYPRVINILSNEIIDFISGIKELEIRGIKEIHYEWERLFDVLYDDDLSELQRNIDVWLTQLPEIYTDFYTNIFSRNNEYKYSCKIDYFIYSNKDEGVPMKYFYIANKYIYKESNIIIVNKPVKLEFTEFDKTHGVISKINSALMIIYNQQLFYDGIRCLLYQGICQKLGYKIDGLNLCGAMKYKLFE